ncbi:MAG TPA: archaemetzincin family Zn-dependent metalloprotease [Candidatus Polarisedimenticolaceae bacterium]
MEALHLVPIFLGEKAELLRPLGLALRRTFGLVCEEHPPAFDPEVAFDAGRGQYNSRVLLAHLLHAAPHTRVLGVAGVDLFVPVLTFVLGEAQLGGRAAIVSIHRLRNEPYGLPEDPTLLLDRLVKEAVHEIGHNFGLLHCPMTRCVMSSSAGVEEVDLKSERFCDRCLAQIRAAEVDPVGWRRFLTVRRRA